MAFACGELVRRKERSSTRTPLVCARAQARRATQPNPRAGYKYLQVHNLCRHQGGLTDSCLQHTSAAGGEPVQTWQLGRCLTAKGSAERARRGGRVLYSAGISLPSGTQGLFPRPALSTGFVTLSAVPGGAGKLGRD